MAQRKYYRKTLKHQLERGAIQRKKRKDSGCCQKCGAPLDPDIDAELSTCQNCRERISYTLWK